MAPLLYFPIRYSFFPLCANVDCEYKSLRFIFELFTDPFPNVDEFDFGRKFGLAHLYLPIFKSRKHTASFDLLRLEIQPK